MTEAIRKLGPLRLEPRAYDLTEAQPAVETEVTPLAQEVHHE